MRVLLTSNASYEPPRGGSTRSNLIWLEALAAAGHQVRVVCAAHDAAGETTRRGISILRVPELTRHVDRLAAEIEQWKPDWVLVSSEDLSHVLLREAFRVAPGRLIFVAHTPQFMPFGPESWYPDASASALVRQARGVVVIGRHMAGYVREHLGVQPVVIHPPIYGTAPWRNLGRFDNRYVLMVNPCVVKGVTVLANLAKRMPHLEFAALAGWGTTSADRALLGSLPNVTMLESVPDIEDVLGQARLLLMPSLWYEGFGLITMEAMLRGLPVVASNSGGLAEAKAGTGYVIPVQPITKYLSDFDENHMPRPVDVEQDLTLWMAALTELTTNETAWDAEAVKSRAAAERFVSALDANDLERYLVSRRKLRVLLAHNSLYYPSAGGGDKSNRLLMEALAARGHHVRVVTRVESFGEPDHATYLNALATRGVSPMVGETEVTFSLKGVDVRTLTRSPLWRPYFQRQIDEFDPDVIVTSTDDPAQLLFDLAVRAPRARVVYLIRATIAVPFGPDSSGVHEERTQLLAQADGVVGVSHYVAGYAREHGGLSQAIHVPISLLEPGPAPVLGRFDNPYVLMVNPCAVKGISILLGLADAMPEVVFGAVASWGTTHEDMAELEKRPNIRILPRTDNIDELLAQSRVTLVPSVWAEARSRMVLESLSRGVPVLGANVGGLHEAMLGVPYLLPVNPVTVYRGSVDEHMVPVAEVPPQNLEPWIEALRRLTTDRRHWEKLSALSREKALHYMENLNVLPFEAYCESLQHRPKRGVAARETGAGPLARLSSERRRLLELRLKERAAWMPTVPARGRRVFCFPWAGAGPLAYRGWQERLGAEFAVIPIRLPQREWAGIEELVEQLVRQVKPLLTEDAVFFGHSMGAGLAFEVARRVAPSALVVSAARAPKLRIGYVPPAEPTDEELLAQLERLGGAPRERLEALLPAFRRDTRLFRRWTYEPGELLTVPVVALGGAEDPQVTAEHLAPWGEVTAGSFSHREFAGGHFYFQAEESFFAELAAILHSCALPASASSS